MFLRGDSHGARTRRLSDNSGRAAEAFQQTLDLSDRIGSIFRSGLQNSNAKVWDNSTGLQHRRDRKAYEFMVKMNPYMGVKRPVEDFVIYKL